MEKFIKKLTTLIREEEQILKQFLDLLNLQKEYLMSNQIEQFQGTVSRQEELIDSIKEIEQRRITHVKKYADAESLRENEITLTHLIEVTLGDASEELKALKQSLSSLVEKIRKANRVNEMLIKHSLNFIQKSVGWLIDSTEVARVYDPLGRTARQAGTNVMVNKTF
ncbi:MAG: flagellar protein FlgN [bacterium]|nr:flagellar protein FlgN [bacterium]